MGLKILHISDIHFKFYREHGFLDLDSHIQNELELDLQAIKEHYQNIDIILIGGDIAFSGKEDEYLIADKWIKKVCGIVGCLEENVLTVPGNHDIDRAKLSPMVRDSHKAFKVLKQRNDIDRKISDYITNSSSSGTLLSPLANYFTFAQKYGSLPVGDNVLFWEKEFVLDCARLKIRGINSALVSDDSDNENTSKLIVGSHQTNLLRDQGVINMVICHHPPQWLIDGDDVQNDLKNRSRVNLFGHKHLFGSDVLNNNCLMLAAGAMQPSRNESGWEPRYNIMELNIPMVTAKPTLNIKLYKRIWNKKLQKFSAEFSEEGRIFEEYDLKLSANEVNSIFTEMSKPVSDLNIVHMEEPVIDLNQPNPKRKLAYMFLGLPYHEKITIAVKLDLVEETDKDLNEIQKSQAYFKRSSDKNLLYNLWEEVTKSLDQKLPNPFTK